MNEVSLDEHTSDEGFFNRCLIDVQGKIIDRRDYVEKMAITYSRMCTIDYKRAFRFCRRSYCI